MHNRPPDRTGMIQLEYQQLQDGREQSAGDPNKGKRKTGRWPQYQRDHASPPNGCCDDPEWKRPRPAADVVPEQQPLNHADETGDARAEDRIFNKDMIKGRKVTPRRIRIDAGNTIQHEQTE